MGKSTLFNRLTQTRKAIVNEEAGTTRDRQYGKVEWCGQEFSVIDTGGWVVNSEDILRKRLTNKWLWPLRKPMLFVHGRCENRCGRPRRPCGSYIAPFG